MRGMEEKKCIYVCKIYCKFCILDINKPHRSMQPPPNSKQERKSKNRSIHVIHQSMAPIAHLPKTAQQCIPAPRNEEDKKITFRHPNVLHHYASFRLHRFPSLLLSQSPHNLWHQDSAVSPLGSTTYQAACPPSILTSAPVINELASLSKNTAAPLYSSGLLSLPSIFWDGQSVLRSGKLSNSSSTI